MAKKKNTVEINQDVLSALIANFQLGSPQGNSLQGMMSKYLEQGDLPEQRGEQTSFIDPMQRMGQFRNQAYSPGGTGKVHFMGGSPFPQSPGQQRAEKVMAGGALASNVMGSPLGRQAMGIIPALIDAWRKRKEQGGQ